jgi:UDP-N-acetyl-D-mannosaminuronic acid dehydrogenase
MSADRPIYERDGMTEKKICVVGLGYIGLPTAALLAANEYDVAGVDIDSSVVDTINEGRIHIVEPLLDEYVQKAVATKRLRAFAAPQPSDVYMLCVPTPFHEGAGIPAPNTDYVIAAARSIAPLLKAGDIVILESTSPVGTTEMVADELRAAGVDPATLSIAYCPERVLPGKIMAELVENDRIVGGLDVAATRVVADFYRTFVSGEVLETDARTAEMCKLTENSFRDVNIAFANELSIIADREGIDVWKLIDLANRHPRVSILQPGTGVGGHCIAVDPWFIVSRNPEQAKLIEQARRVNDYKTEWAIERIRSAAADFESRHGRRPVIACFGLAFKPDIDDLRESPARHVAETLLANGEQVVCVEPNLSTSEQFQLGTIDSALENCDLFALLVKHREFILPGFADRLTSKAVLDFCGALR